MEAVRSMIYSANVHLCFWANGAHTAVYAQQQELSLGELLMKLGINPNLLSPIFAFSDMMFMCTFQKSFAASFQLKVRKVCSWVALLPARPILCRSLPLDALWKAKT